MHGLPSHPLTRLHGGGYGADSQDRTSCWPHGGPSLYPALTPTPGGTWLGCAERGCLYPGGETDPKEGPAAPALYRGAGLCYWLGGAAPREGNQRAAEPLTSLPGNCAHPEPRHTSRPAPWPCMGCCRG